MTFQSAIEHIRDNPSATIRPVGWTNTSFVLKNGMLFRVSEWGFPLVAASVPTEIRILLAEWEVVS